MFQRAGGGRPAGLKPPLVRLPTDRRQPKPKVKTETNTQLSESKLLSDEGGGGASQILKKTKDLKQVSPLECLGWQMAESEIQIPTRDILETEVLTIKGSTSGLNPFYSFGPYARYSCDTYQDLVSLMCHMHVFHMSTLYIPYATSTTCVSYVYQCYREHFLRKSFAPNTCNYISLSF